MTKILGLKIPGGKKGLTYLGLGIGAIALILFVEHKKGAGGHPMPPPRRHPMGHPMGPPMAHRPMPMARAHLANQIPAHGPPARNTLGVGGRISGGYGSGNYQFGSGRIGVPGGGGIAGGYAGYAY